MMMSGSMVRVLLPWCILLATRAAGERSARSVGSRSGDSTMTQFDMELDAAYESQLSETKKL